MASTVYRFCLSRAPHSCLPFLSFFSWNFVKRKSCSLNIFSLRCIFSYLFFKLLASPNLLRFFFSFFFAFSSTSDHAICMSKWERERVCVSVCVHREKYQYLLCTFLASILCYFVHDGTFLLCSPICSYVIVPSHICPALFDSQSIQNDAKKKNA